VEAHPLRESARVDVSDAGKPKASVVVATYNRAPLLERLVGALNAQTLPAADFEIVIVDDCSTDGTAEALDRLARHSRVPLRVLRQAMNQGPAVARNRGAAEARADVIAFTDDDCVPSPGWLSAGLELAGPGRIVVGRTDPAPGQPEGRFSRTVRVRDTRFMQTCNVFYGRAELIANGGFDSRFRRAAGEDTELGMRLQALGASAVFCEEALVHHDVRPSSFRAALREAWGKWIDLPLVVKLHPSLRGRLPWRIFWKESHLYMIAALPAVAAAALSPWLLLGAVPWLAFRTVEAPLAKRRATRVLLLPAAFLLDAAEVIAMVRGSLRHRAFLL
jgi:glycosyltransferase involved in cell wall biosynthesis